MFLTSHYMDEVERVAQRIAVLDHGKIVGQGTAQELREALHLDSLEAAFLVLTGSNIRNERPSAADQIRELMRRQGRAR